MKRVLNFINMLFLSILAVFFIFPFYWVATGSFKSKATAIEIPPQWFPTAATLESYKTLFVRNPAFVWLTNSIVVSLATMVLVCITSTLAGYVIAKKQFTGRALVFSLFVGAMALPKQVILVPLVRLVAQWNFHNSIAAIILPAVGWPFGIFLMKQFSETLPSELIEAADIDGCSELGIFFRIVVPLVKPGIAALAIFTFISAWNDYFLQLIMVNNINRLTLPLGVALLQLEDAINYGVLMAGATCAALPIVIVFIAFQKYFTQGITMGAVKG